MLRYLPGILLLQLATVGITLLLEAPNDAKTWLILLIPVLLLGVFSAFWFASISKNKTQDEITKVSLSFAKERESLRVNAERAKTRLVEKTHKQIASEARKTHGKANFKVGAAFAAAVGAGVVMIAIEVMTLGLMTLTTAGGALGGYIARARKENNELAEKITQKPSDETVASTVAPEPTSNALTKKLKLPKPSILNRGANAPLK